MAFVDDLIAVARREWVRWDGPTVALNGATKGFADTHMEQDAPFWTYVGEYWRSIGSHLDGRDPPAWSAAFISYCFREAGAGDRFPYDGNHSVYVSKIDAGKFAGLSLQDPGKATVAAGDLLWASRSGSECRKPPLSFTEAKKELQKIRSGKASGFCSHCDIVIAVRSGEADVIGGNVRNAVTRTTYKLDTAGRIRDGRHSFVGVIKDGL
jgi:hypothetical protein